MFIICVIVYNLYYCCYAKPSSSAVQKRHSKVYGNPIAPSFYSILLAINWLIGGRLYTSQLDCKHTTVYCSTFQFNCLFMLRLLRQECHNFASWENARTILLGKYFFFQFPIHRGCARLDLFRLGRDSTVQNSSYIAKLSNVSSQNPRNWSIP